jgi:radical SAM superfamily enzyme YgiQ (UPF0313 family)
MLKNKKAKIVRGLLPPLGLGYLASVLEKNGYSVRIIDSPVLGYDEADIIDYADKFRPAVLGISVLTPVAEQAYKLARDFKFRFPETKIILGGAHPTCFPEESINRDKAIDAIVIGEGEYIMLEFVNALAKGDDFSHIQGIYYRNKNGKIIKNPRSEKDIDLETLLPPARHLYPLLRYVPEPFENKKLPATNIIVSRGCAYARCTFCYRSGRMKRKYRIQSPQKTIEEIRYLVKEYRIKEVVFYDDDLISNKNWLIEFCNLLLKEPYGLSWSCRGRCNTTDYETLKAVREAGCWSVCYGFESGNQDLLDNVKKGITLDQSRQVAEWTHKLNLELVGTFMLGLPGETPAKGEKTIDFAIELDCTYAAFIPTHPFIGTELYTDAISMGKFVDTPYSEKMQVTRFIPKISYLPDGYENIQQLSELCKRAYRKFYLRPSYILKHFKKIHNLQDIKRYLDGICFILGLLGNT